MEEQLNFKDVVNLKTYVAENKQIGKLLNQNLMRLDEKRSIQKEIPTET